MEKFATLLIGVLAGALGGLLGVGGGAIMIPYMAGALGIGQHRAHGTSLVVVVATGIGGAATYALHGSLDITASAIMAATATATAYAGARAADALPDWKLKRSFGVFLLFMSVVLIAKPYLQHLAIGAAAGWTRVLILLVSGSFTGFLAGMMGVGGGAISICAMVILLGFDQHTAQGSSLLVMIPAGTMGAWTHWRMNNVHSKVLSALLPGALIGTYIGASGAHLINEAGLRAIFVVFLLWMGTRYIRARAPGPLPATGATPAGPLPPS